MAKMITAERDQMMLMPPSISEWLPENHLARFVVEVVDQMDLSALERQYRGSGKAAFSPALMLSLLFYGYATRTFSSRKIERATYDSVAFRFLAGNTHPDHDTIATFRRRFLPELTLLFSQILSIAREMGFGKVGTVAIDGTKVKANASKHKAMSWKYAQRLEKQLKAEIKALFRKAEEADRKESEDELDIPAEIARRETRLERIQKAKRALEQRAAKQHEEAMKRHKEQMRKREEKEKETGRKSGGKPPAPPVNQGPQDKDQHNFTDPNSRIMKSHGAFEQCYNAQVAVDVEDMLIVGGTVTNNPADSGSLTETLDEVKDAAGEFPAAVVADAGYMSEENVAGCEDRGVDAYLAVGRDKHNKTLNNRLHPRRNPPKGLSGARRHMWRKVHHEFGAELYRVRKSTVEPVIGIIKEVMGFRQFLLRGIEKAMGEWSLVCLAFDIRRLHQLKIA